MPGPLLLLAIQFEADFAYIPQPRLSIDTRLFAFAFDLTIENPATIQLVAVQSRMSKSPDAESPVAAKPTPEDPSLRGV